MPNNNTLLFKNLVIYRFTKPFPITEEQLEAKLQALAFTSCGENQLSSSGFSPALGKKSTALTYAESGCLLLRNTTEEKILPPSVINEEVQEAIDSIEAEQDRKVFNKERQVLKDAAIDRLLPQAFTRIKHTLAYIDVTRKLLVINASTFTQAEKLTHLLRKALGSLPVTALPLKRVPSEYMTRWLATTGMPAGFELGESCELKEHGDEGGTIIARHEDLTNEDIIRLTESGKQVCKLAVNWDNQLTCEINDDMRITKLKFTEWFQEALDDQVNTSFQQEQAASFMLMSCAIGRFVGELCDVLGGLVNDE